MVSYQYGLGENMPTSKNTLGIILAGGKSSRLYPATFATTKQVLPIYDKPLIYYPLSTLMLAGIRDFMIISTPEEQDIFESLLWDAEERMGIEVKFAMQDNPNGIADAFNVVNNWFQYEDPNDYYDRYALILGDNIFYGAALSELLIQANEDTTPTIFTTKVANPERFGVVTLDDDGLPIDLEEKPANPKSDLAVTGLYFYDTTVFHHVSKLVPSARGELEITDLNKMYMKRNQLKVIKLLRGMIWFDTGTVDSLLEASNLIQMIQKHQGHMIGSPHEIAYKKGWIDKDALKLTAHLCEKSAYGKYLLELLET
jgi:glucose-1-phosphate thymidylyltransferase